LTLEQPAISGFALLVASVAAVLSLLLCAVPVLIDARAQFREEPSNFETLFRLLHRSPGLAQGRFHRATRAIALGTAAAVLAGWVWIGRAPAAVSVEQRLGGVALVEVEGPVRGVERRRVVLRVLESELQSVRARRFELRLEDGVELYHGQRFEAELQFEPLRGPAAPGAFDERKLLEGRGLSGRARLRSALRQREQRDDIATQVLRYLYDHRQQASRFLAGHGRGTLGALALGEAELAPEVRQVFSSTGVAHVLAVSGLHFGMVSWLLLSALTWLLSWHAGLVRRFGTRRLAALLVLGPLALYVLYVGAPISATRAFIMACCLLVGRAFRREGDSAGFLRVAALIILCWRPEDLGAIGFQLSFSAVLGLLWTQHNLLAPARSWARRRKHKLVAKGTEHLLCALVPCVGASVATAPFVIFHFGAIPLLGIVANLWVIPVIAYLLLPIALLAAGLSAAWPAAAGLMAARGAELERLLTWSVEGFARLPGVAMPVPGWTALSCLLLAGCCLAVLRCREGWALRALGVVSLLLLLTQPWMVQREPLLRVTFLNVGQGDATLIEFPDGRAMLVDGGGEPNRPRFDPGERVILPYLRSLGMQHLDWMVLSHADFDHMYGLISVVHAMPVGELWTNGSPLDGATGQAFEEQLARSQVAVRTVAAGDRFDMGRARVHVLWPPRDAPCPNRNECSVVMRVEYGWFSLLLTGDIGHSTERALTSDGSIAPVTVLKAAHHGSAGSNSDELLEAASAKWLTYPVGKANRFRFPHVATQRRALDWGLSSVRTADGSVRVSSDGRRWTMEQYGTN
jgi:competence protein ComEC